MAGEILTFDAAGSNVDGTDPGTALTIGPGTLYGLRAFDAPAPPQTVQYAGSVDTEGSLPSSRKHENRQISLTVLCSTAAALQTLQGKIGKIAREGGTLKWALPTADTVIFDLHAADTFAPRIDKLLYVRAGAFCEVSLTLPAKPYGRGPSASVTLSTSTATAKQPFIATATGIKGDVTGLGDLRVTNVTNAKSWLWWGQQSRYYDSASTAALFLEAEDGLASGAALNAGPAGASGSGSNKVMKHSTVGLSRSSAYFIGTGGAENLSHVGTFVVLARVQADSTNTGIAKTRLEWSIDIASPLITNDWVEIETDAGAAIKGSWVIVNLGQVTIPQARLGTQRWGAGLASASTVATDIIHYDWVTLVPVTEGGGFLLDTSVFVLANAAVDVSDGGVLVSSSGGAWFKPRLYEGTYLTGGSGIPPAGAEGRTLRLVVVFTGPPSAGNASVQLADAGNLDAVTVALSYTPRYLVVPSP